MDLVTSFLISLVATVMGILIILWIERQRRPRLTMAVGESGRIVEGDLLERRSTTWPHIQVRNETPPNWLYWVYDGEPALGCRGWITFHHLDGRKVYDREMLIRWSETPEPPLTLLQKHGQDPDTAVALLGNGQNFVDIPCGEYTNIDVVCRMKGDSDCYGWCNESYLHNWQHPAWKFEKGSYIAKIRIRTGGREFTDAFLVVNDVQYEDFRLEPASEELKSRLK